MFRDLFPDLDKYASGGPSELLSITGILTKEVNFAFGGTENRQLLGRGSANLWAKCRPGPMRKIASRRILRRKLCFRKTGFIEGDRVFVATVFLSINPIVCEIFNETRTRHRASWTSYFTGTGARTARRCIATRGCVLADCLPR